MNMTIGEKIRFFRESQGLTRLQLQELSGVKEITIKQYELGNRNPKREYVHKIAKALGVQYTDLDEEMKEVFDRWDSQTDTASLSKEVQVWESITEQFGEDTATFFQDFLSLNPEGQQKASEYMEFLMQKYKK